MADSPDSSEKVNMGMRVHPDTAEKIEQFQAREKMTKSEALRTLTKAGLREQDRQRRFFERSAALAMAFLIAAATVVFSSTLVLSGLAALIGVPGVPAEAFLFFGVGTFLVVILSLVIVWVLQRLGTFQRVDRLFNYIAVELGTEP